MKPDQQPSVIWVLDDGKPGHRNQSLGLAEAIERLVSTEIHLITLPHPSGLFFRIKSVRAQARSLPQPQLIIAAGHRTHLPLIYLAHKTKAHSVVLMRPSLPLGWFDRCLIPEHDFRRGDDVPANVMLTKGALNRVQHDPEAKSNSGLFLIGGESRGFGFDGDELHSTIREIVEHDPEREWMLTDSRRTPEDFILKISDHRIALHSHQETGPEWLPGQLRSASVVWVTEDSVSMIYEALSSGARVGLLPMPRIKKPGRVAVGIESLVQLGLICRYEEWQQSPEMPGGEKVLAEAERCGKAIIEDLLRKL